jgi:hypothetical protein
MDRLQSSWALAKTSWRVLQRDRELLWLPVLSFVTWLAVALLVVVPILATGTVEDAAGETQFRLGPLHWVLGFAGYVALAYVTVYFRAAILAGADERLGGGDPTLRSALRGASARAGRLLPWAVVTVTVSLVLRAIEERAGILGRLVAGIAGLAWALVTFLVLPVIVVEDAGPVDAVKRSAELFRRTWGENVTAQVGFGVLGFVAVLPAVAVLGLGAATGSVALTVLAVAASVVWIAVVSVVLSALGAVFQMALYRFAVDGRAPAEFAGGDLERAFVPRDRRRWV